MASYRAEISTTSSDTTPVAPASLVITHHLAERAEVRAEILSGGHLLHLAVAGCLFNDLIREAAKRGLPLDDVRVSADGNFSREGTSTGIAYSIEVKSSAPRDDVVALVEQMEEAAAIPRALRAGTAVTRASLDVSPPS